MKLKIKITGWSSGCRTSIQRTIETPDFIDRKVSCLGHTWDDTALNQQINWLDDNYFDVVIPLAEEVFMHPIEGYSVIKTTKQNKKEEVLLLAEQLLIDWDDEMKAVFYGSLATHWPTIKKLSIERIFEIVLQSVQVSSKVAMYHLNRISEILNTKPKLI